MPLVRLEVKNEYGLGQPELYREANREDPKAVLDGVAVAGLVGILRQLGDLADFAAEVFHGLQEQVMTTASRSRRLMVRVQNIEASLPPLEKAVLAQTSHIHFAYTSGCEWHPRIKAARNHFIYNDLPHFIMDSYEECHDPPRLHLLDKFDTGGPGSCFKRYSDPSFFKKASANSDETYSEKTDKARKSHKGKKKRSSRKNGELLRGDQRHSSSGRIQFISSTANGRTSSQTAPTIDMTMKSDLENRSNSFDSRAGAGYIECVFHPSNSVKHDEQICKEPSSSKLTQKTETFQPVSLLKDNSISHDSLEKPIASTSSGVTWDEKEEIVESKSQACDIGKTPVRLVEEGDSDMLMNEPVTIMEIDCDDIIFDEESNLKPVSNWVRTDDIDSEPDNYVDALNSIESELENDLDHETKRELQQLSLHATYEMVENEATESTSNLFKDDLSDAVTLNGYTTSLNKEIDGDFPDPPQETHPLISEPHDSNLEPVSPSDIPDGEEMTGETAFLNKESFGYLPDTLQEAPTLTSEQHASNLGSESPSNVPDSEEMSRETVSLNKEVFRNLPSSPQEFASLISEPLVANLEPVGPSDVPVSEETAKNIADSPSSENTICEQAPQTCENSVLDHSVCTDSSSVSYTVNDTFSAPTETGISFLGSKSPNLPDEEVRRINSNNCKSEEIPRESSGDHSVSFWTNGGLLGLQPSKPPVFNVSSSLSQGSETTKSEMDGGSCLNSMQKGNGHEEERDLSEEVSAHIPKDSSSLCSTSTHSDDQARISSAKTSGSSQLRNGNIQAERNTLGEIRVLAPGSVLPAAPDMKAWAEPNQGNGENSSRVFGLGHRLLLNSFNRKVSLDEKSRPYDSLKSIILDQNEPNSIVRQSLPETTVKEKLSPGYPIESLPPSPPLEHMKISFQPVNGLESSKLKLKFPDGSNHHETIRDMFPSFQLVPEGSIPLDDGGAHSDGDDTFCRSSPYVSDDCLSPRSDYNSDQWESEETPESSDHGVYESPHRRSSTESMLTAQELGGVCNGSIDMASKPGTYDADDAEPSLSGPSLDFPSFENVHPALEKESNKLSECNNVVMLHSNAESTPPPPPPRPPPPPPTQWKVSKPQLDITNGTQHYISEDAEHINDLSLPESTPCQQSRLTEFEQIQINDSHESHDSIIHKLKDKLDQKKFNGQKEVNKLRFAKEMDEREDFLQQIRAKSFNLRRTTPEKLNNTAGSAANDKVSAILEKAIAIRQVVASDDGEDDDTWSDT